MILPIMCYNCFRLGHTGSVCKSVTKCSICGETKHNGSCSSNSPKCSNCKGEHISSDKKCPTYLKKYEVKRLMAYENIAMGDARKLVYKHSKKKLKSGAEEFPSFQVNSPLHTVKQSKNGRFYKWPLNTVVTIR